MGRRRALTADPEEGEDMTTTTTKPPRTKPAEVRRDELMDAAQALFMDKGFAATSVAEIVEGAGVAKGTFYTYFQSKDEVLAALRERFIDGFCDRVSGAVDACQGTWPDKLEVCAAACVNAYLDEVGLHDLVFHQYQPGNREMKSGNPVVTFLVGMLREGAEAGAWHLVAPRPTAVMLFGAFHGAVDEALSREETLDRTSLVDLVARFWSNALRTAPA